MIRSFSLAISVFLLSVTMLAQEVLTGLDTNPAIMREIEQHGKPALKQSVIITLPFFDDFSGQSIYPSPDRWANNDVFINTDYPVFPVTAGVATFDALDENGLLYPNAGENRFRADYLTSHSIRLDSVFAPEPKALTAADSIFLSFYFQPEGLGFSPAEGDSLVLEFYHDHPVDTLRRWVRVWASPGMTLNAFFALHGTYFKRVAIPITDTAFLKPGFRFRFYNIASIRYPNAPSHQSNRDHWHLDYVYLNRGRTADEIHYPDIAFANKPGSLLKTYQSMPYRQYRQNYVNEMRDSVNARVTNLSNEAVSASYFYQVSRPNASQVHNYQAGPFMFPPFIQSGYVSEPSIAWPKINFVFPINDGMYAAYSITHFLQNPIGYAPGKNDTIRRQQVFADYFAYDDGTAEAGWGLTNPGFMAYRFKLNTPDTLTRVKIFFNRTLNNVNQQFFNLQIWSEFGGKPGTLIYEQELMRVEYGNSLNNFQVYNLTEPFVIDNARFPGLSFFVGIQQLTPELLNIGFDRNNNNRQHLFYFFDGDWFNTMFDGSLMMRPVFGTTGVSGISSRIGSTIPLQVYPNPVRNNFLNIKADDQWIKGSNYQIISIMGEVLRHGETNSRLDISGLPSGIYLLRLIKSDVTGTARFVVNR